jgi:hypothetical protein
VSVEDEVIGTHLSETNEMLGVSEIKIDRHVAVGE